MKEACRAVTEGGGTPYIGAWLVRRAVLESMLMAKMFSLPSLLQSPHWQVPSSPVAPVPTRVVFR